MKPNHLTNTTIINTGAYYTPETLVDFFNRKIERVTSKGDVLLDNCAGAGAFKDSFTLKNKFITADVDPIAVKLLKKKFGSGIKRDGLSFNSRKKYGVDEQCDLIIVGNIPFSDSTSFSKKEKKAPSNKGYYFDKDMGIAFLKSYIDLNPKYIALIHPASYLTKKSIINRLDKFYKKYSVMDSIFFKSTLFPELKPGMFPIAFTIFERNTEGKLMKPIQNFTYIKSMDPMVISPSIEKSVSDFSKFAPKYKKGAHRKYEKPVAYFFTYRDFGFLKRNQSFIKSSSSDKDYSVPIYADNYKYYCLLDSIKKRLSDDYFRYYNHNPFFFSRTRSETFEAAIRERERTSSREDKEKLDRYVSRLFR